LLHVLAGKKKNENKGLVIEDEKEHRGKGKKPFEFVFFPKMGDFITSRKGRGEIAHNARRRKKRRKVNAPF